MFVSQNDKDRAPIRPPPRSKRPETISSLRENVNNSSDNNGTSNFRNVQKQNSDDSDKSQDSKISSNTMVIRKNNNPAALVISADTNNDPVSKSFHFTLEIPLPSLIYFIWQFYTGSSRRNGA